MSASLPSRLAAERNQKALLELCSKPGNDICADCKSHSPRWTSWNIGVFVCVTCASIHRKIGSHISKVKSVTMDMWTDEQVENMRKMGNIKSNAIYNPNEIRNPPPADLDDSSRDSELEKYIRSKYEYKKFMDKGAFVASKLGQSRSATSIAPAPRSASNPAPGPPRSATLGAAPHSSSPLSSTKLNRPSPAPLSARATATNSPATPSFASPSAASQLSANRAGVGARSVSQPIGAATVKQNPPQQAAHKGGVWDDLVQLQDTPTSNAPLQYQSPVSASFSGFTGVNSMPTGVPGMMNAGLTISVTGAAGMNQFQNTGFQTQFTPTSAQFTPQGFGQPQQQMFVNQNTLQTPNSASMSLFQPTPLQHSTQQQQPQQVGFLTPSPSIAQMHYMTPSPSLQQPQMLTPSHSPAYGMGGMTMTPSPQPQMPMSMSMQMGYHQPSHSPGITMMQQSHSPIPMMQQQQHQPQQQQQQFGMNVTVGMGMQQPMMSPAQFQAGMMNGGGGGFAGQQQQQGQWGTF